MSIEQTIIGVVAVVLGPIVLFLVGSMYWLAWLILSEQVLPKLKSKPQAKKTKEATEPSDSLAEKFKEMEHFRERN